MNRCEKNASSFPRTLKSRVTGSSFPNTEAFAGRISIAHETSATGIGLPLRSARIALITAPLLLAACGKSATPPNAAEATHSATAATQNFVAIARGKVDVEGGLIHLASAREGVVSAVNATAGSTVQSGDVLVALDEKPAQIALDAARAELSAANAQAQLLRAKLPASRTRAARVAEALSAGATSGQSADDARQVLAELNAEIAVAEAGIETARQKVKQADYELQARSLRAPLGARIVTMTAHVGDVVSPQSGELVELLPDKPRIIRAELNEGFVAQVHVGMAAEISSDALPGKTWRARVTRIGDVFGPSKLIESAQEATDARDVECILELDAQDPGSNPGPALRIGQRVQVRFPAPMK